MAEDGPSAPKRLATTNAVVKTKGSKRSTTSAVFSGDSASYEDKDLGIMCPICFNVIESAYMTECGHSFCQKCIQTSLEKQNRCPRCNFTTKSSRLYPNLTLNEIVVHQKQRMTPKGIRAGGANGEDSVVKATTLVQDVLNDRADVSLLHVDSLISMLQQKKQNLQLESDYGRAILSAEFLGQLQREKQDELSKLQGELSVISQDISSLKFQANELKTKMTNQPFTNQHSKLVNGDKSNDSSQELMETDTELAERLALNPSTKKKLSQHTIDLQNFYFSKRRQAILGDSSCEDDDEGLTDFSKALSKFAKYSEFRCLATLNYTSDMYNMYSIVSSIEFDKDSDYFAIAGVTKKIKIYDHSQVVTDVVDMHYPISEMSCGSKISCVAWSPYHKNELTSSDYEGTVTMWDPFTGTKKHMYEEHEKRCWCVDYNKMNPRLLASGSDDSKVKIWSTDSTRSVLNIEAEANVCCVQFNPRSSYHLTFGSADHCVHYYDLRSVKKPLATFKGHKKAVSYAKFLNGEEIVSASTDSQLKLWNVNQGTWATKTFQGHSNEKNFVGLATDSDYIACGSEDNSLCIYYKGLTKMILKYKFDILRSAWQKETKEEESSEFVSAVSWKPQSNIMVVANSQGIIKVLELI